MQRLKIRLLNYFLRHLFPIVDVEKVLTADKKGNLYLNGTLIEGKKLDDLRHEVILYKNTMLWGILSNTLKHQAQEIIFANSKDLQDVLNGKMVLYTLDVQEKIIKKIERK